MILGTLLTQMIFYVFVLPGKPDPETCQPAFPWLAEKAEIAECYYSSRVTNAKLFGFFDSELAEGAKTATREISTEIVRQGAAATTAMVIGPGGSLSILSTLIIGMVYKLKT